MSPVIILNATGFVNQYTLTIMEETSQNQMRLDIEGIEDFIAGIAQQKGVHHIILNGASSSYLQGLADAIAQSASTLYGLNNLEIEVLS